MSQPEPMEPAPDPQDRLVTELLEADRPRPATGFTGALARRLADRDPGWGPRPEHLWPQALALLAAGSILLLIGSVISVGGI